MAFLVRYTPDLDAEMNTGDNVSHYRILSLLGRGGMGVVYLADDLTLGRKIALKFLSHDFARDRIAVERFWREARAASALNHPNICTIHEIAEHHGQPFIAMEWLEGQSLRDILQTRRLSLDELLTLAIDVADGLDAAHRAGVVHRDIKPGNVFVLNRNRAKLLDFGLAKMEVRQSLPPDATPLTDHGVTLGTVAYMSPEQARGENLDARSDLFSLGVVFYEAVTGMAPFRGSSSAVIFHEILGKTPVRPALLIPDTPADLDRLIMKALEKDRDVRCQSAAEILSDLKRLKRDRDSGSVSASEVAVSVAVGNLMPQSASSLSQATSESPSSSSDAAVATALLKRHRAGVAVGAVALVLVLAVVFYTLGTRRTPNATTSAPDVQVEQVTSSGDAAQPAISPDGKFVAYVSRGGLWIRQTATSSNVQIVAPQSESFMRGLTITPDNNFVDFLRVPRSISTPPSLWRVPLLGGTPKLLVDDVYSPVGWSADGRRMAFIRSNIDTNPTSLIVADAEGRNQKVLLTGKLPDLHLATIVQPGNENVRPAWSPDGKLIAYVTTGEGNSSGTVSASRLVLADTTDGKMRIVDIPVRAIAWIDNSSLVITQVGPEGSQLWRLSYGDGTLKRITNDLNSYTGVSVGADRNLLVTARAEEHSALWIGNAAATEGSEVARSIPGLNTPQNVMAWHGDRLFFGARNTIFALPAGGDQPEEILKNASAPAFTSDGKTMVYIGQGGTVWKAESDGRNPVQLVAIASYWPLVTSDARDVIFQSFAGGFLQMWRVPLAGGKPTLVNPTPTAHPQLSPDGKSLVFASQEQNQWFISVCDLPDCSPLRHVRPMNIRLFLNKWTPDGRGIAYAPVATAGNIFIHPLDGSQERQLTHFTDPRGIVDFAWSKDGKRLAIARTATSQDIVLFRGIKPMP
ncbi:MAG TPA: protein kinase [Terriglobia bacterium]